MAVCHRELDSFLSKFRYLSSAGFKAVISFKSEDFVTRVCLDVELPFVFPPSDLPPPSNVTSSPKFPRTRSPSYYRRRLQRGRSARNRLEEGWNKSMERSCSKSNNVLEAAMPKLLRM